MVIIHTSFGDMKAILYDETPLHKENFLKLAKSGRFDSTTFHRVIKNFMIQGGDIDAKEGTRNSDRIDAEFVDKFYHEKGSLSAARQSDQSNPEKKSSWCQFYIVHGNTFTEAQLEQFTIDQRVLNQAMNQLIQYDSHADLKNQLLELQRNGDHAGMQKLFNKSIDLAEKELNVKIRKKGFNPEQIKIYTTTGGAPHLDGDYTVFGKVVEGLDVVDKIAEQRTGGRDKPIEDIFLTMEVVEVKKKEITEKYGYEYAE
ncbi:peptidylprolyl isomerase [Reichenbachiella sp. MALMAid0571]|uniref:peptidylprolyl isomerase n=1 Tax=Reichenbachiella sp. MALMAid0571 TaxID=3143939 RepID=UPI0032DED676